MVKPNNEEVAGRSIKALHSLFQRFQLRECFHADSDCSSQIIKAHSIQKNRILSNLSDNGHILMFQSSIEYAGLNWKPSEIGLHKATVFTGFCKNHDQKIFEPIDIYEFQSYNEEQEFLFAYKALAKEQHTNLSLFEAYKSVLNWLRTKNTIELKKHSFIKDESEFETKTELIPYLTHTVKELKVASKNLQSYQITFNTNLDAEKYSNLESKILIIPNEYLIACSSCISLTKDFKGRKINDLTNLNTMLKYLFLTIFPQNGSTYVLLSYLKKHKHSFTFIDTQILNKNIEEQKKLVSNILLKHVENFTISPTLWNSIEDEKKEKITDIYCKNINPFETNLNRIDNVNIFVDL
jgi:hypothetical protein